LNKLVLWAKDVNKSMVDIVGGKSANLGELYNIDIPIPDCFFLTAQSYEYFIKENNLWPRIKNILDLIDYSSPKSLDVASNNISKLILNTPVPINIKKTIIKNYNLMSEKFVAVRSSATAEDLPEASFAGQQATFLNVKGELEVVDAVLNCWASLFTARAIYYRHKNNFDHSKVYIAVVVQNMVNSRRSGICFTNNPANSNSQEIVVEAGFGLGETIVSGSVSPDTYVLNGNSFEILSKHIGNQEYALIRNDDGGNDKLNLNDKEKNSQKLLDEEIVNLAELAKKIERHYGKPQDIEFAFNDKQLYIVQSRAITTIKKNKTDVENKINAESILKGLATSPGIVSGRVVFVKNLDDLEKIKKGDVLVTKMTTPDMVPAMEKSVGIVTDEGGLTCHAAIVSRELGVPSVVGTKNATSILKENDLITIDGNTGLIYMGNFVKDIDANKNKNETERIIGKTKTKIKLIVDIPSTAKTKSKLLSDGVGLIRAEFFISQSGVHPIHYIKSGLDKYSQIIYSGLKEIAEAFKPRPVWFRTSDLRSDEYRGLKDGDKIHTEDNPMMGEHGIRFSLAHPDLLKAEFIGIKKLIDEGYKNIGVMLPFIIRSEEFTASKKIAESIGLKPNVDFKLGIMCETPGSVWIMEDIIRQGASFISFGTNDLTQLTLGIDRNNQNIAQLFNELHPAVVGQIEKVIKIANNYGVETSICGQAGSNPEMAEKLVKLGINSISVNSDSFYKVKNTVFKVEQKINDSNK
jgi:pyruvate, water dikinase